MVAFVQVVSPMEVGDPSQSRHWLPGSEALQEPANRVGIRRLPAPNLPLWVSAHPLLKTLSVARAQGGTVFHLTDEQWETLVELAGGLDGRMQDLQYEQRVVDGLSGKGTGQGLDRAVARRRCVEDRAMSVTAEHMQGQSWEVDDMHLQESFNFLCTRGTDVMHPEVKGTVGDLGPVNVTAGEVNHAREHPEKAAIAIVFGIQVAADSEGILTANGGTLWFRRPWAPSNQELRSTAFIWTTPS